jgi:flagellar protein FliS
MIAQDYARTYRSNAVLTASPGRLVLMLYDGALKALQLARESFARPETDMMRIQAINAQLLKAQAIIGELQSTLNHNAGGEFSRNLDRLYDYFLRRLIEANLRKEEKPIAEVERLLRDVRDAWAEMLDKQDTTAAPVDSLRGVA